MRIKTCNKCGETKSMDEFHNHPHGKDGKKSHCATCCREASRRWKEKNLERSRETAREWNVANRERIAARKRERHAQEPLTKLAAYARTRAYRAIKLGGYRKSGKTTEYLGCDWETFKKHLESQFTEGMSWDNYGEWHVDHVKPLSKAETEEELMSRLHYTNTQPLWAIDNHIKRDFEG